jgi:DNA-binding transcriptional MerR regulator
MYNIETLAKLSGLTRRTIRYYVQRGLLKSPQGGGRGSYYTDEHLERLKKIQKWSEQGVPLMYMRDMLEGKTPNDQVDVQTGIRTVFQERCLLDEGIELTFRQEQLSYEDLLQIRTFVKELLRRKSDAH